MTTRSNSPYTPRFIRRAVFDGRPVQASYSDFDLRDSNFGGEGSYKYDPLDYPLKNTQQLNVDWSKFENHTFFGSAEVKVNEAFNKIVNGYPFDGTKKEVEQFLDSLTGFEAWVYESFPTWKGALHFSGTQVGEPGALGTRIVVRDKSGSSFPDIAKNNKGDPVLNPQAEDSLSIEALVLIPEIVNDKQVILQKASSADAGFSLYLETSPITTAVTATFAVTSGSVRNDVSTVLKKGTYNHVCVVLNKELSENTLQFYLNETLAAESSYVNKFKKLDIDSSDLIVGSGSSFYNRTTLVTPQQTFSGTLDELRIFHSVRDVSKQKLYAAKGIYSSPDLKLYYRFNEPSGSLSPTGNGSIDSVVLDSSGNALHANISNFSTSLRVSVDEQGLGSMSEERDTFTKILFPSYSEVQDLNVGLLSDARNYDLNNPNIITRLIPQHYLEEGASNEGFARVEGGGGDPYGGDGIPGQGRRGSVQIILSFLYIWAKFYDELKTYADAFAALKTVNYESNPYDTVPDNFLEDLVRDSGFYLPKFFGHATLEQYAEGENTEDLANFNTSLKKLQGTLLRRVLVNMPDVLRSKGTQHSIRSFLRSVGIDPDNSIRIREFGGPTVKQLNSSRERRFESLGMVQFGTSSLSLIQSTPLSGSRVEPGFPEPAGSFVYDSFGRRVSTTNPGDGLFTSGSWDAAGVFKIPLQNASSIADADGYQSLLRLVTTGSSPGVDPGLIVNVVATPFVQYPRKAASVQAFLRPGSSTTSPYLRLSLDLSGSGMFDGEQWHVSIGCQRNDEIDSAVSSSYYLRAAKTDAGQVSEAYVTASYFHETPSGEDNVLRSINSTYNASGSYLEMGPNRSLSTSAGYRFLNDPFFVLEDASRTTDYVGWTGNVRFWSKSMTEAEWREHVRNPRSVGVAVPQTNYNFVTNTSGSFQKLRIDALTKQSERNADAAGDIRILNYSLGRVDLMGTGFGSGSKVMIGDIFEYSYLSPNFDEASTDEKVRIRSFEDPEYLRENPWATLVPSYLNNSVFQEEEPQDDPRLSLEFSVIESLDKDMISMLSDLDPIGDAIGDPSLIFSPDYPNLETLRDVYFNRLSGKVDFRRFLDFYRWFDISVSTFIEQLVPSKTRYKGTNYVVESHMLERHKNVYRHSENYLGDARRITDELLLQQISGIIRKY